MALIHLLEDEKLLRWGLKRGLELQGHTVQEAPTIAEARRLLDARRPDVMLADLALPDGSGLDFLAASREMLTDTVILVMTAVGGVEEAVRAMKLGALDFLTKPVNQEELLKLVDQAVERQRERIDAEGNRRERERAARVTLVAESRAMREVAELARVIARSPAATVLVTGETGTGKEVVARFLHAESPRAEYPILALNCAALPENLVESELFGHEKGSFTDAKASRKGIFELAHRGTVVLDEISELPLVLQSKLLRFLEDRSFRRVGGTREISVDVRLLALTNRKLEDRVEAGAFRADLFYRLNVIPISIPPLRERREDVLPLALHYLKALGKVSGKEFHGLAPELRDRLVVHDWPGNVRELRNLMERIAILEPGPIATGRSLRPSEEPPPMSLAEALVDRIVPLEEIEFVMVRRALEACGGNQSAAAKLLGVSRDQVRYRIKRYRDEGRWPEPVDDTADATA